MSISIYVIEVFQTFRDPHVTNEYHYSVGLVFISRLRFPDFAK